MTILAFRSTMWKTASCVSFFKFLIYFQLHLVESWKMKVCMNGTIYETGESKCRHGIWFVEPKRISNICFERGIWAIYRDWCDRPIIWTVRPGDKGCVNSDLLTKKTLGIVFMGDHERGSLMYTTSRRLFLNNEVLKKGKLLEFVDAMGFEVLMWGSDTYGLEQKTRFSSEQNCLIKGKDVFYGRYAFDISSITNVSIFTEKNMCKGRDYGGTRHQVLAKGLNFPVYESFNNSISMKCVRDQRPLIGNEDFTEEDEDPQDIIQEKVDQQTQRLGLKLYYYRFDKEEVPNLDFEEFRFLKTGLKIFKTACPKGMVPEFFLNNILALFQFILQESFVLFAPTVDKDEDTRLRIRDALKRCSANATLMDFTNSGVCDKDAPLLQYMSAENPQTDAYLIELPKHIRLNAEKFDLILETIWKLMIFIHYYCAESLSQEYSSDLSILQNRWQSLLAPDIIRRWKNPGRTNEMIQQIFMNINLRKTLKNVDYCVGAAHMYSPYKAWLKRPLTKWDFRERNASQTDLMWDGHAYCIDTFAYPAVKLGYPIEKCGIKYL